jgi:8-oxo-dGTP pyrophosphatase MutT (NUDIX family)
MVGMLTHLLIGDQPLGSSHSRSSRSRRLRPRSSPSLDRVHVAAVCYRLRDGEPEFLLVRTRNGHWTFPKGGVDEDPTPADAAAREAYEEAGVTGHVERAPFISYWHCKPGRLRRRVILVHAHLCAVKRLVPPAETYRDPKWFTAEKAKRQLQKYRTSEFAAELAGVIDQATKRIQKL